MSDQDVFDEDLMRELGLDPEEIENMKGPKKAPVKKVKPAPKPQAKNVADDLPDDFDLPSLDENSISSDAKTQVKKDLAKRAAKPQPKKRPQAQAEKPISQPVKKSVSAPPEQSLSQPQVQVDDLDSGYSITEDIPVQLAAVLGKQSLVLKDVIDFKTGQVIDFKKLPNETIDLVANGKLVAKAELVVVDGRLGTRIVKLIK